MKEKIYCPKCDGSDVTTDTTLVSGTSESSGCFDSITAILFGIFGSLFSRPRDGEQGNSTVTHHCRNCGYDFFELESNKMELYIAKKARRQTIATTAVLVAFGALFCILSVWFFGILLAVVGLLLLIRLPSLCQRIRALSIMLEAMEACEEKHKDPEFAISTEFDQNRIPAWKRAQMEAEKK